MAKQLIAKQWQSYRERVIPAEAGAVQVTECRRSFYAGAASFFSIQLEGLGADPEPNAADDDLLDGLIEELEAFGERVKAGTA